MEDKLWFKIICLPIFIQWALTLGVVALLGVFLTSYFLSPVYSHQKRQLALLQTSLGQVNQRLDAYRQTKPYYLLSQQQARSERKQSEAFPVFILSYGAAISNWQESDAQQKATLILGWQSFLQFWEHLIQLDRNVKPHQLQLSAQNGSILIKLTYEKK